MNKVFVDTSGWGNLFVRSEPYHKQALEYMSTCKAQNTPIITTNYVLGELVVLFTRLRVPRDPGLTYIKTIQSDGLVEIVHVDEELDKKGWELLGNRLDKNWSLVDAVSFIVMEQQGIREALTADQDFEQASFVPLLKP